MVEFQDDTVTIHLIHLMDLDFGLQHGPILQMPKLSSDKSLTTTVTETRDWRQTLTKSNMTLSAWNQRMDVIKVWTAFQTVSKVSRASLILHDTVIKICQLQPSFVLTPWILQME